MSDILNESQRYIDMTYNEKVKPELAVHIKTAFICGAGYALDQVIAANLSTDTSDGFSEKVAEIQQDFNEAHEIAFKAAKGRSTKN